MKVKQLFIFIILGILLATTASAATIGYLGWQDSQGLFPYPPITQLTVDQGEDAVFHVYVFAFDNPFNMQVWLKQNNNYITPAIDEIFGIYNQFSNDYNLDTSQLNGNYEIEVRAQGQITLDVETIDLTVIPLPNQPPYTPSNPIPNNGATDVSVNPILQWTGGDPDNDPVYYTVYLNNNIVQSCSNIQQTQCSLSNLNYAQQYSWYVKATDNINPIVQGPEWIFTTESLPQQNNPPIANIVSPPGNQVIDVGTTINFDGEGTDPDPEDYITAYSWEFVKDGNIIYQNAAQSFSYTFNQEGTYIINFKVKDNHNTWSQPDTVNIIVNEIPVENTPPTLTITNPTLGEQISGNYDITWSATDPDQNDNELNIKIQYKKIDLVPLIKIPNPFTGNNWIILEDAQDNNDGIYTWNTNILDNGDYRLKITVTDDYQPNPGIAVQEVSSFVINNPYSINHKPEVTSISGYTDPDSGVIEFIVDTYDQDGDYITQIDFKIYYNSEWHDVSCTPYCCPWRCTFDSTNVIEYDENVMAKARAHDGIEWGYYLQTPPFTIDNTEPQENIPPTLTITAPILGEWISGYYNIEWTATDPDQEDELLNVKIQYKRIDLIPIIKIPNPFNTWHTLEDAQDNNDGIYTWNTNILDNGDYRLKITVTDDYQPNPGIAVQEVSSFVINNPYSINHKPEVTSISGYTDPDSGVIEFIVDTYDQDGDYITQIDFKIYYNSEWHDLDACTEISQNEWICNFDSTIIEYDESVKVKARAHDSIEWGYYKQTGVFTIDNTEEGPGPEPTAKIDRYKFSIANVIPNIKTDHIDLYINIRNKGNKDNDVTIKATVIQTGLTVYDSIDIDVHDNLWRTVQLPKLSNGIYVLNVQAYTDEYKDNRLVVLEI